MKKILITRPLDRGQITATYLKDNGFNPLICPLTTITFRPYSYEQRSLLEKPMQAVIVTSAYALGWLKQEIFKRDMLLLCVGKQTAVKAQEYGYENIEFADASAQSLVTLIKSKLNKNLGKLIYLSAEQVRYDFTDKLRREGYDIERWCVYDSLPVPSLPEDVINNLKHNEISTVLFYSKTAAETWRRFSNHYALDTFSTYISICAISEEVFLPLQGLTWKQCCVMPALYDDDVLVKALKND